MLDGSVPVLRCQYVYHGVEIFWPDTKNLQPAPVECVDTEYVKVLAFQCVLRHLRQPLTNQRAATKKSTDTWVESSMKEGQSDAGHPC